MISPAMRFPLALLFVLGLLLISARFVPRSLSPLRPVLAAQAPIKLGARPAAPST